MGVRPDFKGDYMGFTYNGKHSSELGIVRVSDGSRFNENLLPTMQDKTVQVPGGDGMYYFGSYYTQRQFSVNFAFDSLDEAGIAKLKRHFGDKQIHDLIFDETPYKVWSAKVTGTATLKYIPFGEGETGRTYKGEGTIQFTCYNPYARSNFKFVTTAVQKIYPNYQEWLGASGMLDTQKNFDKSNNEGKYPIYNPGDKDSDFLWVFTSPRQNEGSISIKRGTETIGELTWNGLTRKDGDDGFVFDSRLGLIRGAKYKTGTSNNFYRNYELTSNIYNNCITGGSFFKIPRTTVAEPENAPCFEATGPGEGNQGLIYNYYYL